MANKVKFGLSNCYYAKITETEGTRTYGTPVAMKGAVSLDVAPDGDATNFAADNIYNYYSTGGASNLSGDLEMALIDDNFKKDILGYLEDTNGALYITGRPVSSSFAPPCALQLHSDRTVLEQRNHRRNEGTGHRHHHDHGEPGTGHRPVTRLPRRKHCGSVHGMVPVRLHTGTVKRAHAALFFQHFSRRTK